jgi:SulP family sulfate permease
MVVPLLGGSSWQVTGATAAFVVISSVILSKYGLRGLMIAEMMAGIWLIMMGIAKLGKYISYIPYPVTIGFTSGIAVLISILAINDFLGLGIPASSGDLLSKLELIARHIHHTQWPELLVGLTTLITILRAERINFFIPPIVTGISFGILVCFLMNSQGYSVTTVGDSFAYLLPNGEIGRSFAAILPTIYFPTTDMQTLLVWPNFQEIRVLLVPSLVIAGLCALQTLLSATVADSIVGTKHQPNAELLAIGAGNILAGMTAGLPASGAIARTEMNIHSGARTPFASSLHALFIMLYVMLLAPYMFYIPMTSLAALLLTAAYHMSHWRQFIRIIQLAPRSEVVVLIVCFGCTIFIGVVEGVTVGVILSCFLLVKRIANLTQSYVSHASTGYHSKINHLHLPKDVMLYHINGSLFFGAIENAFNYSDFIRDHIKTLIIDIEDVPFIDMTGLIAMKTMILTVQNKNRTVILCGSHEITNKILQKLSLHTRRKLNVVQRIDEAIEIIKSTEKKHA